MPTRDVSKTLFQMISPKMLFATSHLLVSFKRGSPSPTQTLTTSCSLLFSSRHHKVGYGISFPSCFPTSILLSFCVSSPCSNTSRVIVAAASRHLALVLACLNKQRALQQGASSHSLDKWPTEAAPPAPHTHTFLPPTKKKKSPAVMKLLSSLFPNRNCC